MTKKQYNKIIATIAKNKKEYPEGTVIGLNTQDFKDIQAYCRKWTGVEVTNLCGLEVVHSDDQQPGVCTILQRNPAFSKS